MTLEATLHHRSSGLVDEIRFESGECTKSYNICSKLFRFDIMYNTLLMDNDSSSF